MTSPGAIEFGALVRRLTDGPGLAPEARRALEHLGERLWDALRDGHSCLRLASLRATLPPGLDGTHLDGAVRHAVDHAPWLLDIEHERVWLRRMARLEQAVADGLRALDVAAPLAEPARIEDWIAQAFGAAGAAARAATPPVAAPHAAASPGPAAPRATPDASQRHAVRVALARRLLVLTGGPGTGKTATLARIVHAARDLGGGSGGGLAVRVAAPTGKAAARLGEQLRARGVAGIEPSTVHALLEIDRSGRARRDRSDPIAADLVLIDECSMLDLRLCARLLDALAPGARLVLAGDRDQLASVDPGAVFAELTAPGVLPDALVALDHNFRQQDAARLAAFAEAARLQRIDEARAALRDGGDELRVREPAGRGAPAGQGARAEPAPPAGPGVLAAQAMACAAEAVRGYRPLIDALRRGAEPAALLDTLGAYRLLTALREGPLGAVALNRAIGAAVRARCDPDSRSPAWRGRLLMVTANDREQRLWNGDVGLCTGDGTVLFADAQGDGVRRLPHAALPAHEDAFAMTVHKAQGSEFDAVTLLPAPGGHALAVRELLYTGITRARRRCTVHADAATLAATLAAVTRREGALGLRLRSG